MSILQLCIAWPDTAPYSLAEIIAAYDHPVNLQAAQEALPVPPAVCPACGDCFTSAAYARGDYRVWSCSNGECPNSSGVILCP